MSLVVLMYACWCCHALRCDALFCGFRMMEAVSDEECLPSTRDLCLQLLANVTRVQVRLCLPQSTAVFSYSRNMFV